MKKNAKLKYKNEKNEKNERKNAEKCKMKKN